MTLLFGQFPQAAFVAGQFALHAVVGSVGDIVPPLPEPPQTIGGGGSVVGPAYIRRDQILTVPPVIDEELAAALTVFFILETDSIP